MGFLALIDRLDQDTKDLPLHEQIDHVIQNTGLIEHFRKDKQDRGEARIEGDGARMLNMIHRDDLIRSIIAALERGRSGEIYNAVDDIRASNPASNPELLDALTAEFVKSGFDVRASRGSVVLDLLLPQIEPGDIEIAAALMLSLATLGIAWSGYQAAKWSGLQARRYTQASAARSLANRSQTQASQARLQDLLNFNRWLEVKTEGNTELTALYERRFRDEFRPAFAAWLSSDPLDNPHAIPSPLLEKQYVLADAVKADRLEKLGDLRFEEGKQATENADDYVFVTVFFAVVLFFAGISLRFTWFPIRIGILALAAAFAVSVNVSTGVPIVGAALFPVGFCMLYLFGFDLLTGVFVLVPLGQAR